MEESVSENDAYIKMREFAIIIPTPEVLDGSS